MRTHVFDAAGVDVTGVLRVVAVDTDEGWIEVVAHDQTGQPFHGADGALFTVKLQGTFSVVEAGGSA